MCPHSKEDIRHNCDKHVQMITSYLYITYYVVPNHICKWILSNGLTTSLLVAELKV